MVSTLAKVRQLDFVIKAFAVLQRKDPRYKLYFIGDGDEKPHLQELVKKLKMQDSVIFEGRVPHELMPKYISCFDIGICHIPDLFVFRQSFPLKILEYLSCHVPVLASDIPANREVAKNLKEISLYEFTKDSFITSFFNTHINKTPINQEKLKNKYDWTVLSKKYLHVYSSF